MGKKFVQVYSGDVITVTGKVACCSCGLVHYLCVLPRQKGRPIRMQVLLLPRSTAMKRRHNRAHYRKILRKAGLSR